MRSIFRRIGESFAGAWLIVRESVLSFVGNAGFDRAAALAFYCFLSMVPLLLIEVLLVTHVIRSSDSAINVLQAFTERVFPFSNEFILKEIAAFSLGKSWGILSVLLLVWSVTPLAAGIRGAFEAIFRPEKVLTIVKAKARDVIIVVVTLVLLVAAILIGVVVAVVVPVLSEPLRMLATAVRATLVVIGLPLVLMLFFRVFVPVRLKLRHLVGGSVITAILLSIVGPFFEFVLRYNPNYGVTFGSLKAIFLLFVWTYYSFLMILIGTEIMANMRRREAAIIRRLFAEGKLRPTARRLIRGCIRQYGAGEEIFKEGEEGGTVFYVLKGVVSLERAGKPFREMKESEYFGEMAMLLGGCRTMTARAVGEGAELVLISKDNMEVVLKENPEIVQSVLREMANRLKITDESIRA